MYLNKTCIMLLPWGWFAIFCLLPFGVMVYISLVDMGESIHPFVPLVDAQGMHINWENYLSIVRKPDQPWFATLYVSAYGTSLGFAFVTTMLCLCIGYPCAWRIARCSPQLRLALLMMIVLPFWVSLLVRVYAWKGLLSDYGVINNLLLWLGVIDKPLQLLYSNVSMMFGMVYVYLPFMVLPLYATFAKIDMRLVEAATDLGATPMQVIRLVVIPLSWSGIIAGCILVGIPSIGEFVIPTLLGGAENTMISQVVWNEMFVANNWPRANALAVMLIILIVIPLVWYGRRVAKQER